MSIASEIERIKTNIANAYTTCQSKGATMPAILNSANLSDCIASITGGTLNIDNGYVTDGLLVHLSGLKTKEDNIWKDENRGINATLYNGVAYDSADKSYSFDGISQYASFVGSGASNDFTLEVYYKQDETSQFDVMTGQSRGYHEGYGIANTSSAHSSWITKTTGNAKSLPTSERPSQITGQKVYTRLSRETATMYFDVKSIDNNITKTYAGISNSISPTTFTVAKAGSNPTAEMLEMGAYSKAKIYAIRLYNRKLTDEEIQQNYEQDVLNFGE